MVAPRAPAPPADAAALLRPPRAAAPGRRMMLLRPPRPGLRALLHHRPRATAFRLPCSRRHAAPAHRRLSYAPAPAHRPPRAAAPPAAARSPSTLAPTTVHRRSLDAACLGFACRVPQLRRAVLQPARCPPCSPCSPVPSSGSRTPSSASRHTTPARRRHAPPARRP